LVLTAAARSTAWSLPKFHPLPTIFPSRISSRAELHRSDFLLDGFVHPAELVFMGVAVPHELGAGLFVPDPVSTLARFLRRCSVLLFSFDLAAGAGLRAKNVLCIDFRFQSRAPARVCVHAQISCPLSRPVPVCSLSSVFYRRRREGWEAEGYGCIWISKTNKNCVVRQMWC
jgi:hypothetical protein